MAKKEDKQNKTIRSAYYFHQVTPIIGYAVVLTSVIVAKSLIGEYYPKTSKAQLDTYKTTITNMKSTVTSLNLQNKTNLQEKQQLETVITELRQKKEADGSLRFYTINLPAYGRYVEFRANSTGVEIIDVDIHEDENLIDYVILGDYNSLMTFFNTLETREIYYIENFELIPSFNNNGSYVKFTANFNLDSTITERYEKKIKFEQTEENSDNESPTLSDTLNKVPEDESLSSIDVDTSAPEDTLNTGKYKDNVKPSTENTSDTPTQTDTQADTQVDTVIVEPMS